LALRSHLRPPLFPYTTLFRSLASSSPIHVTARAMLAHRSPAVADYTGNARLWQDANIVEAPSIRFDRDQRSEACVTGVIGDSGTDRKSTRLNSSHDQISYAVF